MRYHSSDAAEPKSPSLCQILDRVLDKGAVVSGEVTLSLADVDLVYLNLKLLLVSSAKLHRLHVHPKAPSPELAQTILQQDLS